MASAAVTRNKDMIAFRESVMRQFGPFAPPLSPRRLILRGINVIYPADLLNSRDRFIDMPQFNKEAAQEICDTLEKDSKRGPQDAQYFAMPTHIEMKKVGLADQRHWTNKLTQAIPKLVTDLTRKYDSMLNAYRGAADKQKESLKACFEKDTGKGLEKEGILRFLDFFSRQTQGQQKVQGGVSKVVPVLAQNTPVAASKGLNDLRHDVGPRKSVSHAGEDRILVGFEDYVSACQHDPSKTADGTAADPDSCREPFSQVQTVGGSFNHAIYFTNEPRLISEDTLSYNTNVIRSVVQQSAENRNYRSAMSMSGPGVSSSNKKLRRGMQMVHISADMNPAKCHVSTQTNNQSAGPNPNGVTSPGSLKSSTSQDSKASKTLRPIQETHAEQDDTSFDGHDLAGSLSPTKCAGEDGLPQSDKIKPAEQRYTETEITSDTAKHRSPDCRHAATCDQQDGRCLTPSAEASLGQPSEPEASHLIGEHDAPSKGDTRRPFEDEVEQNGGREAEEGTKEQPGANGDEELLEVNTMKIKMMMKKANNNISSCSDVPRKGSSTFVFLNGSETTALRLPRCSPRGRERSAPSSSASLAVDEDGRSGMPGDDETTGNATYINVTRHTLSPCSSFIEVKEGDKDWDGTRSGGSDGDATQLRNDWDYLSNAAALQHYYIGGSDGDEEGNDGGNSLNSSWILGTSVAASSSCGGACVPDEDEEFNMLPNAGGLGSVSGGGQLQGGASASRGEQKMRSRTQMLSTAGSSFVYGDQPRRGISPLPESASGVRVSSFLDFDNMSEVSSRSVSVAPSSIMFVDGAAVDHLQVPRGGSGSCSGSVSRTSYSVPGTPAANDIQLEVVGLPGRSLSSSSLSSFVVPDRHGTLRSTIVSATSGLLRGHRSDAEQEKDQTTDADEWESVIKPAEVDQDATSHRAQPNPNAVSGGEMAESFMMVEKEQQGLDMSLLAKKLDSSLSLSSRGSEGKS
ncbi:unnamed protein product [Amoebophrya sp. A25]|nr:unnamed protein product [Amoebophrya sp. A25]|eukprot:GSA25T00006044001.1